jgi:hypothetical protein
VPLSIRQLIDTGESPALAYLTDLVDTFGWSRELVARKRGVKVSPGSTSRNCGADGI